MENIYFVGGGRRGGIDDNRENPDTRDGINGQTYILAIFIIGTSRRLSKQNSRTWL
jgi:hypothetical protein